MLLQCQVNVYDDDDDDDDDRPMCIHSLWTILIVIAAPLLPLLLNVWMLTGVDQVITTCTQRLVIFRAQTYNLLMSPDRVP